MERASGRHDDDTDDEENTDDDAGDGEDDAMMGDCGGCELGWWSRWNRRSAWIGSGVCMITSDEG